MCHLRTLWLNRWSAEKCGYMWRMLSPRGVSFNIRETQDGRIVRFSEVGLGKGKTLLLASMLFIGIGATLFFGLQGTYQAGSITAGQVAIPFLICGALALAAAIVIVSRYRTLTIDLLSNHVTITYYFMGLSKRKSSPLADLELGIHQVALSGRTRWHGWASVVHVPTDSLVIACHQDLATIQQRTSELEDIGLGTHRVGCFILARHNRLA